MRRPEVNNFIAVSPQPNVYDFSFLAPCPTSGQVVYSDNDELVTKESIIDLDDRKHTGTLAKVSKASFEIKWKERQPKKIGKGKVTVAFTKNFNFGEYKKVQIILN